jgi:hypothetical protein
MIVAARFQGAGAFSYRLPFVAVSSTNGQFRHDQGHFLNQPITGSLDIKAFPSLDADLSAVLPVDYLSGVIADMITTKQQQAGEDYDFVNPLAKSFNDCFGMLSIASGVRKIFSFREWHRRALAYATAHSGTSLTRITAVFDGYTDQTAGSLMKGNPVGKYTFGRDTYPLQHLTKNTRRSMWNASGSPQGSERSRQICRWFRPELNASIYRLIHSCVMDRRMVFPAME